MTHESGYILVFATLTNVRGSKCCFLNYYPDFI